MKEIGFIKIIFNLLFFVIFVQLCVEETCMDVILHINIFIKYMHVLLLRKYGDGCLNMQDIY